QILQPATRRRRLYADDPLSAHLGPQTRQLLQQSLADFDCPDEVRELGMALFIDRPLGVGKLPGEPDQTPLMAHAAFSRSLAIRRYGIDVARAAVVIIRVASPTSDGRIAIFDKLGRERLELAVDVSGGFQSRGGVEYPAAGLRLVRVWQESGDQLRELSVSETI